MLQPDGIPQRVPQRMLTVRSENARIFYIFINTVKLGYNELGYNELGYNELGYNELGYNEQI